MSIDNLPAYLWSWGANGLGQLGDGGYGYDVSSPVQVGIFSPYKLVNSQVTQTFGFIDKDGNVFANGKNTEGQMGNNTTTGYLRPTQLPLSNVADIRFGSSIMCKKDGTLYTWGANSFGQCGHGDTLNRSSPVQISGVSNVIQVTNHNDSCGYLTSDGKIFFAGRNNFGQFGNNNTANSTTFVESRAAGTKVHSVYQGANTFYFLWQTTDSYGARGLFGSGLNNHGQLAMNPFKNNTANSSAFIQVTSLDFKKIAVSNDTVYGISSNDFLWCWGYNLNGECGQNKVTTGYSSPVQIAGLWEDVQTSTNGVIALKKDNTLWTWGYGASGQLGTNQTNVNISSPTQIQIGKFVWNAVQKIGTCSYAWQNAPTATPIPTNFNPTPTPTPACNMQLPTEIGLVAWFDATTLATLNTNISGEKLSSWKNKVSNPYWGQMYQTDENLMPTFVTDNTYGGTYIDFNDDIDNAWGLLSDLKYDISSNFTIIVIETCRTAKGISRRTLQSSNINALISLNQYTGNDGIGSYLQDKISAFLSGDGTHCGILCQDSKSLDKVRKVTYYVDGVDRTGFYTNRLYSWGSLVIGAGGIAPKQPANTNLHEILIYNRALSEVEIQAINQYFVCKYINNKNKLLPPLPTPSPTLPSETLELYSWGWGQGGTKGDNTNENSNIPVFVGTYNVSKIIDGTRNCAGFMTNTGTIYAWGNNSEGTLGNGTTTNISSPTIMPYSDFKELSLGASIGINKLNQLQTWGYNQFGQNGQNDIIMHSSPTTVSGQFFPVNIAAGVRNSGYGCKDVYNNNQEVPSGIQNIWSASGFNESGALGINNVISQSRFTQIPANSTFNFANIKYGVGYSLFLFNNNTLGATGDNSYGQLGWNKAANASSVLIIGNETYKDFYAGWYTAGAITNSGKLYTWGKNQNGQCGTNSSSNNLSKPTQVGTESNWSDIKMNETGAIALKSDGTLWTWGNNAYGGIGDGTFIDRSSPVQIMPDKFWKKIQISQRTFMAWCSPYPRPTPTPTPVPESLYLWAWGDNRQGAIGNNNTTSVSQPIQIGYFNVSDTTTQSSNQGGFITTNGVVYGWGANLSGPLGNNTATNVSSIQQIPFDNAIKIGFGGTIAIKNDNTLWTCGYNAYGGLGLNDTINRSSPVQVSTGSNIPVSVGNSSQMTAYIDKNGKVWAAGKNNQGSLGLGDTINRSVFTQVPVRAAKSVSFGFNNIFILLDGNLGELWGSGSNNLGQLGRGNVSNTSSCVGIVGGVEKFSCGDSTTAVIKFDGSLWMWGDNSRGECGQNSSVPAYSIPVQVCIGNTWLDVAISQSTTIAVRSDNTLWAWGNNAQGSVGNNSVLNVSSPTQIGIGRNWKKVAKGGETSYAWSLPAKPLILWSWGAGASGVNGNNSTENVSVPVQIGTYNVYKTLINNTNTNGFVLENGTVYGWGSNGAGNYGIGTSVNASSPTVLSYNDFIQLELGGSIGLKANNTLWTWGYNYAGARGQNNNQNTSMPVLVNSGSTKTVAKVTSALRFGGYIANDRTGWAAGFNAFGALGNNNVTNRSSFTQVGLIHLQDMKFGIAHGLYHRSAQASYNDTLWACGQNSYGQLGTNKQVSLSSPVQVLTDVNKFSCGWYTNAAIKNDGTLWTWGKNNAGQCGLNHSVDVSSPCQVGGSTNWTDILCNETGAVALKSDNTLWCWGYNAYGGVGNGSSANASSPVQIGLGKTWRKIGISQKNFTAWSEPDAPTPTPPPSPTLSPTVTPSPSPTDPTPSPTMSPSPTPSMTMSPTPTVTMATPTATPSPSATRTPTPTASPTPTMTRTPSPTPSPTPTMTIPPPTLTPFPTVQNMTMLAWGSNNSYSLGVPGLSLEYSSPIQVGSYAMYKPVYSNCGPYNGFITPEGNVYAWGDNNLGELGDGTAIDVKSPTIMPYRNVQDIRFGSGIMCTKDWKIYTWGFNDTGCLGTGNTINMSNPCQINIGSAKPISVFNWSGQANSTAKTGFITDTGEVYAAGSNQYGQLTFDPKQKTLINSFLRLNISDVVSASFGAFSSYFIKKDGSLWSVGENSSGQLGLNDTINRSSVEQVLTNRKWKSVSAMADTVAAIDINNSLYLWGRNTFTTTAGVLYYDSPIFIFDNCKQVTCMNGTIFALKTDNTLWGIGNPSYGQFENYKTKPSSYVQVGFGTSWQSVQKNTVSVFGWAGPTPQPTPAPTGTPPPMQLWGWGANNDGQIGLNNTIEQAQPVQIGQYNPAVIANNGENPCFVNYTGTVIGWGATDDYQLGQIFDPNIPFKQVADVSMPVTTSIGSYVKNIKSIAIGNSIACDDFGNVYVWGRNQSGACGIGNGYRIPTPTNINYINKKAIFVCNGPLSTGFVTADGFAFAAGLNISGRYGNNKDMYNDRGTSYFTQLPITNVKYMNQGYENFCWIKSDNSLWASGKNKYGSLGQNDNIDRSSPVQIAGLWKKVCVSNSLNAFMAGIKTDGTLWCWGDNYYGQCGQNNAGKTGGIRGFSSPVQVSGSWSDLWVANYSVLAINSDNSLYGWGSDYRNILGNGPNIADRSSPAVVYTSQNINWKTINGISSDGSQDQSAFGWRSPIYTKTPTPTPTWEPTPTPMPTSIISLFSWGDNASGQLGLGTYDDASAPTQVGNFSFNDFSAGNQTAGFVTQNGTFMIWGANNRGQLGLGNTVNRAAPTVLPLNDIIDMSISETCIALNKNKTVWTWGDNSYGQLGLFHVSGSQSSPVQVFQTSNPNYKGMPYKVVSCSNRIAIINDNGIVYQAGYNASGQAGNNTSITYPNSLVECTITGVKNVYLSSSNSYFHMKDDSLYVCGSNEFGQMGNNYSKVTNVSMPVLAAGKYYYKSFSCPDGLAFSVAGIKADNTLWTWGDNHYGQLGVNDLVLRSWPVQVPGTWHAVVSQGYSMIAIKSDNTLWAWGLNSQGQLGNNSKISCSSPVQIGITTGKWIGLGKCKYSAFAWRI